MGDHVTGQTGWGAAPIIAPFEGHWPEIHDTAFIAPGAVVIGRVTIGPEASIWYGTVLRGDDNRVVVGARTNVQDGTVVHCSYIEPPGDPEPGATIIGEDVVIGHGARLHGCRIAARSLIGIGAVVLDGAVVGDLDGQDGGAMIAAGALVTPRRQVPAGELWGGTPARKMRDMGPADRAYIDWDLERYAAVMRIHKTLFAG